MDQPTPTSDDRRHCGNCAFAIEARIQPHSIEKQRQCRRMPPHMVLLPTPQGANLVTMFPVVNEHMLCNEHRNASEIMGAPVIESEKKLLTS